MFFSQVCTVNGYLCHHIRWCSVSLLLPAPDLVSNNIIITRVTPSPCYFWSNGGWFHIYVYSKYFFNFLSVIDFIVLWSAVSLWIVTQSIVISCIWPNFEFAGDVVINPGFLQKARQKVWRAIHFKLLLSVLESNFCLENVSVWFDNECVTFDLWQTWRDPLHTWELEIKLNGQILLFFFLRRDGKSRKAN